MNTCHWIGAVCEGVQSCPVYQLINCHIDVDWWLLVIELLIFLKMSGFGLITKFQICLIEVDWWLLYIKLVIFLHTDLIQWQFPVNFNVRYLWTGIMQNLNTLTLSILDFLAANLISDYLSFTERNIWRYPEFTGLPTLKFVTWTRLVITCH